MQKYFIILISMFVLISCSSQRPKEFFPVTEKSQNSESKPAMPKVFDLDLKTVQTKLGMQRAVDQLGFEEKRYGEDFFSIIYFRIQCRDSEGTVEFVSESEFTALSAQLFWQITKLSGNVLTDEQGFGQIRVLSKDSIKNRRLVLKSNSVLLAMKVEDVQRFIVPIYWCQKKD